MLALNPRDLTDLQWAILDGLIPEPPCRDDVRSGIMRGVLEGLVEDLQMRGRLDVREAFIDGSFAPAKKGE